MAIFLSVVFIVHAAAFGFFYVARGRRLYNLLFLAGFVLLAAHYGHEAAQDEGALWLRYAGLVLVMLATPPFVAHRVRSILARRASAAR